MNRPSLKHLSLLALTLAFAVNAHAQAPRVSIRATDPTALEGTTSGAFPLIRHGNTNGAGSVGVAFSGTASNGVDYAPISSVITIPAGELAVDIPVLPIVNNA